MSDELSPALVSFVRAHVQSIEQLEVMLHVCGRRERGWTADEVAGELRIQPRSAKTRLELLASMGVVRAEGDVFRCDGKSAHLKVIEELAAEYQTRRVRVIELVFSRPADNIKVFADAFVIGGRKRDKE